MLHRIEAGQLSDRYIVRYHFSALLEILKFYFDFQLSDGGLPQYNAVASLNLIIERVIPPATLEGS